MGLTMPLHRSEIADELRNLAEQAECNGGVSCDELRESCLGLVDELYCETWCGEDCKEYNNCSDCDCEDCENRCEDDEDEE